MGDGPAVLDAVNLVARDMEVTLAFYRLLGVDIPEGSVWRTDSGAHHVDLAMPGGMSLDVDSVALAQSYNAGWRRPEGGGGAVLGFRVPTREDVDRRYASLREAGYTGLQEPYDTFWGSRYAIVEDPDGREVGIMSPPDPARRTKPPAI